MTCKSFCALILLVLALVSVLFFSRQPRSVSFRQYAFPAMTSSAKLSSVFVDSGAFPNGIYNDPSAFVSLNRSAIGRIYGLFSSSAPSGSGDVSMWVPVVHKTLGTRWKHVVLPDQLYHRTAQHSLLSTHLADTALRATPFLTRATHCLVFDDGWIAPFSPDCTGIFMQVVYAPADSPPSQSLPPHCIYRPIHDACVVASTTLASPHALTARPPPVPAAEYDAAMQRRTSGIYLDSDDPILSHAVSRGVARSSPAPHVPQLSDNELRVWRMMGFPFNRQWRWAYDSTLGHGLTTPPPPGHMFTDLHVLPARMRALPFARFHAPRSHDVVGALIHIDYHTGGHRVHRHVSR